mgnify:CR=1 FL=1
MNQQQRATRTVLPLKAAIYHAVHDIRGGVGSIAGAYGYNVNTLQHKISLTNDGRHVLTVPELASILEYTRDSRIMDSLCHVFGDAAWFDLSGLSSLTDASLFAQVGEMVSLVGDTTTHVAEAMADGYISADELAQLERDAARLHATIQTLISTARARMEGTA